MSEPKGLTLKISVTDIDMFQRVLEILEFAYDNSSDEAKKEIEKRMEAVLGKTHDVGRALS